MNILKHCINEKRAANNILFVIYIQASAALTHGKKKNVLIHLAWPKA